MDAKSLYHELIERMSREDALEVLENVGIHLPDRKVTVCFTYEVEREFILAPGDPGYSEDEYEIVGTLEEEIGEALDSDFEFIDGVVTHDEMIER